MAGAKTVQQAKRNLDRLLAAAQLGITMASLAIGWLGEPTIGHLLHDLLGHTPGAGIIAVAIAFTIITALHIVVGEQAPKLAALEHSEGASLLVACPLILFAFVFHVFIVASTGRAARQCVSSGCAAQRRMSSSTRPRSC